MGGYHRPVLLKEVLGWLKVEKDKWYLDATVGDGGHTLEVVKLGGKVVGMDVDRQALIRTKERLEELGLLDKVILISGNFRNLKNLLAQTEARDFKFAGSIFDLGVSTLQLETPERGFSFSKNGPLDMRMDQSLQIKALDLVNSLSRKELCEIFKNLGEEKYSRSLADAVVLARQVARFSSTRQLAEVIERKFYKKRGEIHPATRIFQALRIAVNDELEALRIGLSQIIKLIDKGVVCVISYHSLEDRIVKHAFKTWQEQGLGEIKARKPIIPTEDEILDNKKARSAKLRVFEKL